MYVCSYYHFLYCFGFVFVGVFSSFPFCSLLLCFLHREVALAFVLKLVWWCWILIFCFCLSIKLLNGALLLPNLFFPGKEPPCSADNPVSIVGLGRSPWEGNDYQLWYSCLMNSRGQRNLVGYTLWGLKYSDTTEQLSHTTHSFWLLCQM